MHEAGYIWQEDRTWCDAGKAIRVRKQEQIDPAIEQAEKWMAQYKVPVVIEIILERVTNIAMGTEINNVIEFEELAASREDAPSAVGLLD